MKIIIFIVFILIIVYFYNHRYEFYKPTSKKGSVDLSNFKGQKCNSNSECTNDACGRLSAKDGAETYCCPYGPNIGVDTYGGYDYCKNMPENAICFSDSMCMDGYECSKPNTTIQSKGDVGCYDSVDNADNCALYYSISGVEELIGGLTKKGQCVSKSKKAGDVCDVTADVNTDNSADGCKYGCGYTSMSTTSTPLGSSVCCGDNQYVVEMNGDKYCAPFSEGAHCDSDKICGTGSYCTDCGLLSCSEDSVCNKQKPINDPCESNNECLNQLCGRETAATDKKICCPYETDIGLDTYEGLDYCKRMPDDSICWSDSMCESGTCEGGSIFEKGICASSCGGQVCPPHTKCISQIKNGTNFSVCCKEKQVGQAIDLKMMCCADGSLYDSHSKVCRAPCGEDLCVSGEHCMNEICVKN